jgi:hypothetical protein
MIMIRFRSESTATNHTTVAIHAKQYRYLIRSPVQVVLQEIAVSPIQLRGKQCSNTPINLAFQIKNSGIFLWKFQQTDIYNKQKT